MGIPTGARPLPRATGHHVTGRGVLGAAPPCEQGAGLRFGRDDGHPVEDTLVDPGISPRSTITPGPTPAAV
nr:hypothetical protein [Rhodococcus wratislaviensis]